MNQNLNSFKKIDCAQCGNPIYLPSDSEQPRKFCSKKCRNAFNKPPRATPYCVEGVSTGTVGAVSELIVSTELMKKGWSVFRALSPSCFCDLVAIKNGVVHLVEVKTGKLDNDGYFYYPSNKIKPDTTRIAVYIPENDEIVYLNLSGEVCPL